MLKTRYQPDSKIEAGLDEVGRGCLWGPMVTAAVIWPPEDCWMDEHREMAAQVKDSKKLSEKKRKVLSKLILDNAIDVGFGVVEPWEIDANGMTWANQTAFGRAVHQLNVEPERLLVDGIVPLTQADWPGEQHTIVEGDAQYIPIAAASIVAKVYRDTWVEDWCAANQNVAEQYGLLKSKGYGTAAHRKGLQANGPHELHRRLFLRKLLGEDIYRPKLRCKILDD
jgi:ribonuclease HII